MKKLIFLVLSLFSVVVLSQTYTPDGIGDNTRPNGKYKDRNIESVERYAKSVVLNDSQVVVTFNNNGNIVIPATVLNSLVGKSNSTLLYEVENVAPQVDTVSWDEDVVVVSAGDTITDTLTLVLDYSYDKDITVKNVGSALIVFDFLGSTYEYVTAPQIIPGQAIRLRKHETDGLWYAIFFHDWN